jgi:hypothetical protein
VSTFWAWVVTILIVMALGGAYYLAGNPTGGDNSCSYAANNGDPLPASCP